MLSEHTSVKLGKKIAHNISIFPQKRYTQKLQSLQSHNAILLIVKLLSFRRNLTRKDLVI